MESDLQVHCGGIDYRDRWRFDSNGRRKLTLRRINTLLRHLPQDSATVIACGGSGWRLEHYLLADVYGTNAKDQHPWYPKPVKGSDPERTKRLREAKARARERQRAIDAGEII